MKKRSLKTLKLNKKQVSDLQKVGAGATPIAEVNNTGCIGPYKHTCGIVNCNLM